MANYQISTINSTFRTMTEPELFEHSEQALAVGVGGAVLIAGDEISAGAKATAIEVTVSEESGKIVEKAVVSISVSPILTEDTDKGEIDF